MTNQVRPTVEVNLDKPRRLKFDLNAMVAFERETGKSMFKLKDTSESTVTDLRALLWAALLHEDPNLTIEAVGTMIGPENMEVISDALIKVWEAAVPEVKGDEEDEDPLATKRPPG